MLQMVSLHQIKLLQHLLRKFSGFVKKVINGKPQYQKGRKGTKDALIALEGELFQEKRIFLQ